MHSTYDICECILVSWQVVQYGEQTSASPYAGYFPKVYSSPVGAGWLIAGRLLWWPGLLPWGFLALDACGD